MLILFYMQSREGVLIRENMVMSSIMKRLPFNSSPTANIYFLATLAKDFFCLKHAFLFRVEINMYM